MSTTAEAEPVRAAWLLAGGGPRPATTAGTWPETGARVPDRTGPTDPERLVAGPVVDDQTRCAHWHGPLDVVAIRLPCCAPFWPCHACHEQTADHPARSWPAGSDDVAAVLCGVCGDVLRIGEYQQAAGCPRCAAPFNPGCRSHHHLYFG